MHAMELTESKSPAASSAETDDWFVTNGVEAVGPVTFELMRRGLHAGRIPAGSLVRHTTWKVWRRLEDIDGLSDAKRTEQVAELAQISVDAEVRASNPRNEPPPPPAVEELIAPANEQLPPSVRPPAVDPVNVFATAETLEQAFLLAVSTAVTAASAFVGLVHVVRSDLNATVCTFAQGPGVEPLLGERLADNDPSLLAAQAGHTIVAEPRLGEAGRHIAGRIARALPGPRGVAMVPVRVAGGLIALIELGRNTRAFRAREIAAVEDVVDALAKRIVEQGWL